VLRIKSADGTTTDHQCISFPWLDHHKNGKEILLRLKSRSITDDAIQRLDPPVGRSGFFGWHLVPKDAKSIIITESEWDAMAVYQQTGQPAVALPAGGNALPVELINKLEPFEQIYLWMSDDVVGQESAKKWFVCLYLDYQIPLYHL
jgi:twinkle protein